MIANLSPCSFVNVVSLNSENVDMEFDKYEGCSDIKAGYTSDNKFFVVKYKNDDDEYCQEFFPADLVCIEMRSLTELNDGEIRF